MVHRTKIHFRFFNTVLDTDYVESCWSIIVDQQQGWYKLDNIPFFLTSYALGDVVYAEDEAGQLVVKNLVEESGNSTLQIVCYQSSQTASIQQELERLGCSWEGSHLPNYFSVNVPAELSYLPIKSYLKKAEKQKLLSYREACLAHTR
ncbi:DUF4265 domain-containing protein [Hymenobacter seoulensis]